MSVMLVEQKDRSIKLGVVGVGQCGSKIAEEFFNKGYDVAIINTALQDLKTIKVLEKQKLFLDFALGGAAKDLDTGRAAVEKYLDEIKEHVEEHTGDCDVFLLVVGGGGGSGSGSAEVMARLLNSIGKPVAVLFVLPMESEDSLSKHNAVNTLAELAKLSTEDVINSLIVVDNAKIEKLYPNLSMAQFWRTSNRAIVEPLHLFNELSANPSEYISLDPMDFSRVFLTGDCTLYGMIEIEDYLEEDAIATAIVENMENGLLAGGFNLAQTRSVGVIITGGKEVLEKIPAVNIEYGFAMVNKLCADTSAYRGIYEVPGQTTLKVYSMVSGLGLPEERVMELKEEGERHLQTVKDKEETRGKNMSLDFGSKKSTTDLLHKKIKDKKSPMDKIKSNSSKVIDRRRK